MSVQEVNLILNSVVHQLLVTKEFEYCESCRWSPDRTTSLEMNQLMMNVFIMTEIPKFSMGLWEWHKNMYVQPVTSTNHAFLQSAARVHRCATYGTVMRMLFAPSCSLRITPCTSLAWKWTSTIHLPAQAALIVHATLQRRTTEEHSESAQQGNGNKLAIIEDFNCQLTDYILCGWSLDWHHRKYQPDWRLPQSASWFVNYGSTAVFFLSLTPRVLSCLAQIDYMYIDLVHVVVV